MTRGRLWLVEMTNSADRRDDEVWKVRAADKRAAKAAATAAARHNTRFTVGRVASARGDSTAERALARAFRTYCTRELP